MTYINPAAIETCEECGKSFPDAQSSDEHECNPPIVVNVWHAPPRTFPRDPRPTPGDRLSDGTYYGVGVQS